MLTGNLNIVHWVKLQKYLIVQIAQLNIFEGFTSFFLYVILSISGGGGTLKYQQLSHQEKEIDEKSAFEAGQRNKGLSFEEFIIDIEL